MLPYQQEHFRKLQESLQTPISNASQWKHNTVMGSGKLYTSLPHADLLKMSRQDGQVLQDRFWEATDVVNETFENLFDVETESYSSPDSQMQDIIHLLYGRNVAAKFREAVQESRDDYDLDQDRSTAPGLLMLNQDPRLVDPLLSAISREDGEEYDREKLRQFAVQLNISPEQSDDEIWEQIQQKMEE